MPTGLFWVNFYFSPRGLASPVLGLGKDLNSSVHSSSPRISKTIRDVKG